MPESRLYIEIQQTKIEKAVALQFYLKSNRFKVAEPTGLEPATSDVTGRRSNQLNYDSALKDAECSDARCWFLYDYQI